MTDERLVLRSRRPREAASAASTCYDAARRGELPTIRLGRRLLVPRHALDELLGLPVATTDSSQQNGAAANGAANERRTTDEVASQSNRPGGA